MNKLKAFIPNLLTLGFLGAFLLFSCNEKNESLESEIYHCIKEEYGVVGVDFEYELEKIEDELIQKKVLRNSEGESYFKLYQAVQNGDRIPNIEIENNLFPKLNGEVISCITSFYEKNEKLENSALINLLSDLRNNEILLSKTVARLFTENLTEKDFEKDFYKALTLINFHPNSVFFRDYIKDKNSCTIKVLNGKILFNEKEIALDEIYSNLVEISKHLPENEKRRFLVDLSVASNTTYDVIEEIKVQLRKAETLNLNYQFGNITE